MKITFFKTNKYDGSVLVGIVGLDDGHVGHDATWPYIKKKSTLQCTTIRLFLIVANYAFSPSLFCSQLWTMGERGKRRFKF